MKAYEFMDVLIGESSIYIKGNPRSASLAAETAPEADFS
jgi:hypothetical protein